MTEIKSSLCFVLILAFLLPPVAIAHEPAPQPASNTVVPPDEIKLSVFSHRRVPNLFWRIDASGKGELSAPQSVGYQVTAPLIVGPDYRIAPGVHRFDIGPAGYNELRAFLAQTMDGKHDAGTLTDGACLLSRDAAQSGSIELDWSGKLSGGLHLQHDCLNGAGRHIHNRMLSSWFVLAQNLYKKGNAAVAIEKQPVVHPPRNMTVTEKNVWTGATRSWRLDANGRGWIEFSHDGTLPTLALGESNFVKAGRYHFRLGRDFHQAVLREFDVYLSGAKTVGSCEDEISMSDQPLVRLNWLNKAGKPASFASDLGCPSFAQRYKKVELAFAELIRSGALGESRLLTGK